jgi:dimethylargininase
LNTVSSVFTGNEFFVGLSKRTDQDGIDCLARTFPEYRVTAICINDFSSKTLHLKSACSVCGPNHILVGGELGKIIATAIESSSPGTYKFTHVVDEEAANCVYSNGTLIRRTKEEFPNSADGLKSIGGKQIEIRASELAKVDAALTCCSVLF